MRTQFPDLDRAALDRVYDSVWAFFSQRHRGVFGGPITAGDGLFIAAMMERIRPQRMVEFGVASGLSSAFILHHARIMGLALGPGFLTSFDLMEEDFKGRRTGRLLLASYPDLAPFWRLNTRCTSLDILEGRYRFEEIGVPFDALAFVDGGHNHPWPIIDLLALRRILTPDSWVVMQDTQMMERWIADAVIHGVACPIPVRGVNLAFALWPGRKIVGHHLCYNCGAISLRTSDEEVRTFVTEALSYPDEIAFDDRQRIASFASLSAHP